MELHTVLDRRDLEDHFFQLPLFFFFLVDGETEAQHGRVSGPNHTAAEQETNLVSKLLVQLLSSISHSLCSVLESYPILNHIFK